MFFSNASFSLYLRPCKHSHAARTQWNQWERAACHSKCLRKEWFSGYAVVLSSVSRRRSYLCGLGSCLCLSRAVFVCPVMPVRFSVVEL